MIDPNLSEGPVVTTARTLRQFAALWLLFFGALAAWQALAGGDPTWVLVSAGIGLALGPLGLAKPEAIRPVFQLLTTLTAPIGWVISHLILACLFYVVFTPIGLLFRLLGRDALARRRRPGQETYWRPKPSPSDFRSYLRQS
jgi:hypothetical protein